MSEPLRKRIEGESPSFDDLQNLHLAIRSDIQGYERLAQRLKVWIGVDMPTSEKNRVLMACRLAPLLRRHRCRSYAEYEKLLGQRSGNCAREFISAMTTHTTGFYREPKHFNLFASVLEQIAVRKKTPRPEIRIWCAASSTGQEPYTMLFSYLETGSPLGEWNLKFLASDIDRVPLLKASKGQYTTDEMKPVPKDVRRRYFIPPVGTTNPFFTVRSEFRRMITFAEFNLSISEYPFEHPFDIIFCRNVLIYFDLASGAAVVGRLIDSLATGGFLFVGHSEIGFVRSQKLRSVDSAVFQKI